MLLRDSRSNTRTGSTPSGGRSLVSTRSCAGGGQRWEGFLGGSVDSTIRLCTRWRTWGDRGRFLGLYAVNLLNEEGVQYYVPVQYSVCRRHGHTWRSAAETDMSREVNGCPESNKPLTGKT